MIPRGNTTAMYDWCEANATDYDSSLHRWAETADINNIRGLAQNNDGIYDTYKSLSTSLKDFRRAAAQEEIFWFNDENNAILFTLTFSEYKV